MPTLNIEGKRVTVDDAFLSLSPEQQNATVEEIARSIGAQGNADPMAEMGAMYKDAVSGFNAPIEDTDRQIRAALEATKINQMRYGTTPAIEAGRIQYPDGLPVFEPSMRKSLGASAEGLTSGATFGFDDEIGAGMGTPMRMLRDQVGPSEAYAREKALQDELKARRRQENPVASMIGEIGGGIGTAGALSKGGATLVGRNVPGVGKTGAAMLEGGAYGGAYGAGEAESGERLKGAATGAAIGFASAGILSKTGDVAGKMVANRAAKAATPALDDLAQQSNALYDQARQAGVVFKPKAVNRLTANMQMAAGRINRDLRPKTAGILDDVMAMKGKPLDLQAMDELRQTIGQSMKRAEPQDVRTLQRMKDILDNFADSAGAREVTGDVMGLQYIKEARAIYARKQKTQMVEELLDLADVNSGKYSQSGLANAIRMKAESLYKQISKGKVKGFSQEEVAMIRKMAKGGSNSQVINLLAKFAPRGVVSIGAGSGLGGALGAGMGGPVGAAVGAAAPMAIGAAAGKMADRGALAAATALRDSAARGTPLPQAINRLGKYVPLAAPTATQLLSPALLQPQR